MCNANDLAAMRQLWITIINTGNMLKITADNCKTLRLCWGASLTTNSLRGLAVPPLLPFLSNCVSQLTQLVIGYSSSNSHSTMCSARHLGGWPSSTSVNNNNNMEAPQQQQQQQQSLFLYFCTEFQTWSNCTNRWNCNKWEHRKVLGAWETRDCLD